MGCVSFIVMEPGSEWPGHVGTGADDLVAIAGDADALPERTRQALVAVDRKGLRVRLAVLACGEAMDLASRTRRCDVVAALVSAVKHSRFGRVVLSARASTTAELRGELLRVAGSHAHALGDGAGVIAVRFSDPPSGVRARLRHA
jgi:hypothetical protein